MTAFRSVSLVPCLVLLTATIATAQQDRAASQPPLDNGYMTAAMGASFSDTRAATFGIEIAETLHPRVQAYAAFNCFDNLFNDQASSDLVDLASYLTRITGDPWQFSGRDRGLSFSGGAKYLLSQGPTFRPYVGGGPGVLNLQRTITERTLGDVSDPVLVVFGAPDGFIEAREESTFRAMAEFVAGVGMAHGRTYVDVGYRYRTVFHVESFSFSQFTVGVGMRF